MDGGGAGSNLSILKEAKKIIWASSFLPGGRDHLLIPMDIYRPTSYDFPCQESLSSPPLWMILILWLFLGCNKYWSGLVYVFHLISQEHPTARLIWHSFWV